MNIKAFFVDALGQALELGIGTPDDVLRHVPPELLARHLPRPLWARLFTACLGAPRVDAQLVVETIGVANLCEHLPVSVIWASIAEIGARSLGPSYEPTATRPRTTPLAPTPVVEKRAVLAPPPDVIDPVAVATPAVEPLADLITELEQERPVTSTRSRTPTGQRFRQNAANSGPRLGLPAPQQRRPQAAAAVPAPAPTPVVAASAASPRTQRRGGTESDPDSETEVHASSSSDWRDGKKDIPVDDSQLVDWQSTETTQATTDEDFSDIGRKRS